MKEKLKKLWANHKGKLIFGGAVIVGGVVIYMITRKTISTTPVEKFLTPKDDFWWNFTNLDEALVKFKEIEEICIEIGKDEVAIFGGGGLNAGKYTVMHLS